MPNLGNIVGLIKSEVAPAKTYVIWGKITNPLFPDIVELHYYDGVTSQWVPIVSSSNAYVEFTEDVANEYNALPSFPYPIYKVGSALSCRFDTSNTGTTLVSIAGLGQQEIKKNDGNGSLVSLVADDIQAGIMYILHYDGTDFQLLSSGGSGVVLPKKLTFTYLDFSDASLSKTIDLDIILQGNELNSIIIKIETPFSGGGVSTKLQVGVVGNLNKYYRFEDFDLTLPTNSHIQPSPSELDYNNVIAPKLTAIATGANLDQLTAGEITVYIETTNKNF